MPSERRLGRALALLACLGLATAAVPVRAGQRYLLTHLCGTGALQRIPSGPADDDPHRRDCPSPCHATCPRKNTGFPQDDCDDC